MNEANEQARLVARKIIKRLATDISDRRGLGDEWEQIDSKVMEDELVPAWMKIIAEEVTKASGQQPEAAPNDGGIAGSSSATLLAAFDDALNQNPFLWMEIGYTRPTDWMVHVWDRTRKTDDDSTVITTQSTNRETACQEATQKLRDYLSRGSS